MGLPDILIAEIYVFLANYHSKLKEYECSPAEIKSILLEKLNQWIASQEKNLIHLDKEGKTQAYKILALIAGPIDENNENNIDENPEAKLPKTKIRSRRSVDRTIRKEVEAIIKSDIGFNNDVFVTWYVLTQSMEQIEHFIHHYVPDSQTPCEPPLVNNHHHHHYHHHSHNHHAHDVSHQNKDDDKNNACAVLLVLLLIAVALIGAIVTLISLYYLISETLNSFERLIHNEGWLQALITLTSIAVGAAAGALLNIYVGSIALTAAAVFFGFSNPIGWIVVGSISASIITAALTTLTVNFIQNIVTEYKHSNALDPSDPHRFGLTAKESRNLEREGYDPLMVKCAIVALRMEIGGDGMPSVLSRFFNDYSKQELLNRIRKLKHLKEGDVTTITINGRLFNLRSSAGMTHDEMEQLPPPSSSTLNYFTVGGTIVHG